MPTTIFTANLDLISTGVMPGVNEEHVPMWVDATDVLMEDSGVRPAPGFTTPYADNGFFDDQAGDFDDYAGLFDNAGTRIYLGVIDSSPVKGIHVQKQSDGRLLAVWGTDTALFTFNGLSTVDASRPTPYSGTDVSSDIVDTSRWSFAQWGDWVVATNGADTPQVLKYPGSTEFEDLAGFPASNAQLVRTLGPHIVFCNISGTYAPTGGACSSNQIIFCAEDDIEEYDPTVNVTAGELTIRDFAGPILAAEYLNGTIILYGETSSHVLRYGGQFLFSAQKGAQGLRAVAKDAVASVGSKHIVLSQNGLFGTDGVSFVPAAYPAFGTWLENVVDWTQRSRIAHMVDVRRSTVYWSLPGVDRDFVLSYNWLNDKLAFAARPFTAGTRVESLWKPLAGFRTGELKMLVDPPVDRAPVLVTKPLMIGGRTLHAFIDALVSRWSGADATVEIKFAEAQNGLAGTPWEPLGTISEKETLLYVMRETMFVQLRISSADVKWVLSGLELLGTAGGGRL